jgi:hypothetical protein
MITHVHHWGGRLEYCSSSSNVIGLFSSLSVLANSLFAVASPAVRSDEYENFSVVYLHLASQYPIPRAPYVTVRCSPRLDVDIPQSSTLFLFMFSSANFSQNL